MEDAVEDAIRVYDPYHEKELWDEIKENKIVRKVSLSDNWEVNRLPMVPYLKVVCISDTHEKLQDVDVPGGDVLIHAGDFTNAGDAEQLIKFNQLMGSYPHRYKLVVPGNHELGFDPEEDMEKRAEKWAGQGTPNGQKLLTNVTILQDTAFVIDGVRFYGSSWHPLPGFPFYRKRRTELAEKWKAIPNNTDILITHSPPLGYLDKFEAERWGCRDLLSTVEEIKPKFHVFGHVHDGWGAVTNEYTTFINAAQCSRKNKIIDHKPLIFYFPKRIAKKVEK